MVKAGRKESRQKKEGNKEIKISHSGQNIATDNSKDRKCDSCLKIFPLSSDKRNAHYNYNKKQFYNQSGNIYYENIMFWQGCRANMFFISCWWKFKWVQPICRIIWQYIEKLKMYIFKTQQLFSLGKQSHASIQGDIYISVFVIKKIWQQSTFP